MRSIFLCSLLAATGCASVVPTTAAMLGMANPMTADPADYAIRLTLPPQAGIVPDSAFFGVSSKRTDTGQAIERKYTLQESPTLDGARIYKIARKDFDDLRQTQATVRQWEDENPSANSGSLSVGLQGCIIGDGPAADALVNVALQIEEGGRFMPLIRNAKWQTVVAVTEAEAPVQCPSALDAQQ